MIRKSWKLTAGAVAVGSVLLASGCSASGTSGSNIEDPNDLKVHWLAARSVDEGMMKAVQQIADEYKGEHPGFELEIESIPNRPDYLQKVRILASSNELPDWFDADTEPYFQDIVNAGQTVDIGSMYDDLGLTDRFYGIGLDYPKLDDGSIHSMTFQGNIEHFWYNKDLFAQAGVTPPTTLDELVDVAKELDAAGITPIAIDGTDRWPQMRYLSYLPFRQTGNEFIEGLRSGDASMSDEEGLATATYFQELAQYFQEGWSNADYNTARDLFTSGDAAIYYIGSWELPSFVDDSGNLLPQYGRFVMPQADSGNVTPATDMFAHAGIGTAINAQSDSPAMRDWVQFLMTRFADVSLNDFNSLPSMKPTTTDGLSPVIVELLDELQGVNEFAHVWDVRLDPDSVDVIARESTNLGIGQITPEEFATRVDEALANNR